MDNLWNSESTLVHIGASMNVGLGIVIFENMAKGISFGIMKILVQHAPSLFACAIRNIGAGIVLLGMAFLFKKNLRDYISFSMFPHLIRGALLRIFIPTFLSFWALTYIPALKLSFFFTITPFIAYFFSFLIFSEKMTFYKGVGMFLGISSVFPMMVNSYHEAHAKAAGFFGSASFLLPDIAVIIALFSVNYGGVLLKKLRYEKPSLSILVITGFDALLGGLLGLTVSLIQGNNSIQGSLTSFIGWVAMSILFTNVLAWNLYAWLVAHYTTTFLALASLLAPFFTALFTCFYLGESLKGEMLLSTVLVLLANFFFYCGMNKKGM
jgi:drug/metabolite transporter (DMT)-like permease